MLATDRFDGSKDDKNREKLINKLKDKLSDIRNNTFNPTDNEFDKTIVVFNELCILLNKSNTDKNPIKICRIARYIVKKHYPVNTILDYYREILAGVNDVDSWKFGTHKTAIDRLCVRGIKCDGLRAFTKDDKNSLFKLNHHCEECNKDLNFDEATVDHIKPWSEGGKTDISNGRILCAECNSSKGATYDEEGEY